MIPMLAAIAEFERGQLFRAATGGVAKVKLQADHDFRRPDARHLNPLSPGGHTALVLPVLGSSKPRISCVEQVVIGWRRK
jgi:hypothetical protein